MTPEHNYNDAKTVFWPWTRLRLATERIRFVHGKEEDCTWMFETTLWRRARAAGECQGSFAPDYPGEGYLLAVACSRLSCSSRQNGQLAGAALGAARSQPLTKPESTVGSGLVNGWVVPSQRLTPAWLLKGCLSGAGADIYHL